MAAIDLCTRDEFLKFKGKLANKTDDVDVIDDMITQVSTFIISMCNLDGITTATGTEYFSGNGTSNCIHPKNKPINSVTLLADDTDRTFGSDSTFASDEYVISDSNRIELLDTVFNKGIQNIKLIYSYGEATTPHDLKLLCLRLLSKVYDTKLNPSNQSITRDGSTITRFENILTSFDKQIISKYRVNGLI